jgi:hypothetical protein
LTILLLRVVAVGAMELLVDVTVEAVVLVDLELVLH